FPNLNTGKPYSDMALLSLLRRNGHTATVHGFRQTFRTWAAEEKGRCALLFAWQPLDPPLKQDTSKREPVVVEGQAIDTLTLGKLSEYQQHLVREAKAVSAEKLSGKAKQVRERYDETLVGKMGQSNVPLPSARRQVRARHGGILLPDVELDFDDLDLVTVATVLADPKKFVGETLADP